MAVAILQACLRSRLISRYGISETSFFLPGRALSVRPGLLYLDSDILLPKPDTVFMFSRYHGMALTVITQEQNAQYDNFQPLVSS